MHRQQVLEADSSPPKRLILLAQSMTRSFYQIDVAVLSERGKYELLLNSIKYL